MDKAINWLILAALDSVFGTIMVEDGLGDIEEYWLL